MTTNIHTGKRPFGRRLGAVLVSGQFVVVLALLLSNVGAVQAQMPADDTTGTETPSGETQDAENPTAEATATEAPPTEPSAPDTSVTETPSPESGAPVSGGIAPLSASAYHKISPANLANVPQTNQFQLKWSDAGIDLETPGGDSYFYCIDESDDTNCDTGWVQKRNLQTAAGDVVVVLGHTYYWQVRTDVDGRYADCPTCWWSFTVVTGPTKTISGTTGVTGTNVNYAGTTGGDVTAGAGGTYSITIPYDWSGTVTPSLSGYSFSPASRAYMNVVTNQTNQNYTPGPPTIFYTISGNAGSDGVSMSFAGDSASGSTMSVLSGGYSFTVAAGWTGMVMAAKTGCSFTPSSKSYINLSADFAFQDYAATCGGSNHAPVITEGASVSMSTTEAGFPNPLDLTLHATDVDLDTLTWSIGTPAVHGSASASGTGASKAILYSPVAGYNGPDSFVVVVSDGLGGSDLIAINLTVQHAAPHSQSQSNAAAMLSDEAQASETSSEASSALEPAMEAEAAEAETAAAGAALPSATATVTAVVPRGLPHPGLFRSVLASKP